MKNKFLKPLAFAFAAAAALSFAGCTSGTGNVEGAYKLRKTEGETEYHVVFELSNPTVTTDAGVVESAKLRLVGVYLDIRYVDAPKKEGALVNLDRSSIESGLPQQNYEATLYNQRSTYSGYVAPFSLGTIDFNYNVVTYKYYRLTAKTHDVYLDEIVFVGEILNDKGEGSGERMIIPAKVISAVRQEGESEATARRNAEKLLDNQPSSAEAFQ